MDNYKVIKKENKSYYYRENKIYYESNIRNYIVLAYLHGHSFSSSLCAKLYKKEFLISSRKFLGDDLFLNLEIFLKVKKVKIIKSSLYYYRLGGFTNKHMSYHFNDIVEGYKIQNYVMNNYTFEKNHQRGSKITLSDSFNVYLQTLLNSRKNKEEIKEIIRECLKNIFII